MDAAGDRALRWLAELSAQRAVDGLVDAGLVDATEVPSPGSPRDNVESLDAVREGARGQRRHAAAQVAAARAQALRARAMRQRVDEDRRRLRLADAHAALGDVLAADALRAEAPTSLPEVLERSRYAALLADDERRIRYVNPPAVELLARPSAELLGLRLDELLPPDAERDARWAAFRRGEKPSERSRVLLPDGRELEMAVSAMANVAPGTHLFVFEPFELPSGSRPAPILRPREREVMGLVATGATSADIAARLVLSTATVESHIRNAVARLGARNRTHASVLALQRGELALRAVGAACVARAREPAP